MLGVMSRQDVLLVLGTGMGKSVCFMLPALALKKSCVVIVPTKALMADLMRSSAALSVTCECWDAGMATYGLPTLVLVQVEQTTAREFRAWLQTLLLNGSLCCICIDEIHLAFQWNNPSFRPRFNALCQMRSLAHPVPWLFLTATLSQQELHLLTTSFNLEHLRVIQGPVVQLRHYYQVCNTVNDGFDASLLAIQRAVQRYPNDKGICYSATIAGCGRLVQALLQAGITFSVLF